MKSLNSISENYAEIIDTIRGACFRSKRKVESVHLMAVSKLQSIETIEFAYKLGIRDFGENYVQELVKKRQELYSKMPDIKWHLIGNLQSNKSKLALENADSIQSVHSIELAEELAKKCRLLEKKSKYPIFLQVNIEHEASKSGFDPEKIPEAASKIRKLPELEIKGLMCIPEPKEYANEMRPVFQALKQTLSYIEEDKPLELSMGMSDDFEVAIEEGAHWIRVGRRLFGDRRNSR